MVSNNTAPIASDIADPDMQKFLHEGLLYNSEDDTELQSFLKVSSEVDMTIAYCSDKLANLESLLLLVLAGENDIEAIDFKDDNISEEFIEKAFTFDLLFALLNFELKELENLMAGLQDLIMDALHKMSSCEHSKELLSGLKSKLHDSEDLLKRSQERALEMKIQLAKLQMTSFVLKQNECKSLAFTGWKSETMAAVKMLEMSLTRQMELEKKLTEVKQSEEESKSKIRLVEKVAVCMEEAADVAWSRFLEADNTAEIMMGISKELQAKLQIICSNPSGSTKREEEILSKLQNCSIQLNEKETSIQKLNITIAQLNTDNAEIPGLRERARVLEEKLNETESWLNEANASNEMSQHKIKEMEDEIESLSQNVYAADIRAEGAEEKVQHLTDTNLELTEELDFVKGNNDSNTKKVSLLEKQLRELDLQLQHSRASSEASQEQQNMLYSAIWDMETLIDELKQKVAIAESKTESAEERCIMLSETNSELNKKLDFLRSRMELVETSLDQATVQKRLTAKDINIRTSFITDMVMQLAVERERIQKQLVSLTKENKLLREKWPKEQKNASVIVQENRSDDNDKPVTPSGVDSADSESAKTCAVNGTEISTESSQVEESPLDASRDENGNCSTNLILKVEPESLVETGKSRRTYIFMATLVLLLSILAAHLFHKKFAVFRPRGS